MTAGLTPGIVPHDQRLAFLCQTRLLEYALDIRKQNLHNVGRGMRMRIRNAIYSYLGCGR